MSEGIAARVGKGAKRYDSMKPDWWTEENVDIATLDESHPRRSVAGQNLAKESERGGKKWDGTWDYRAFGFESQHEASAEGFYFTIDEDGFSHAEWDTSRENQLLTEAWKKEIINRRT